MQLVPRDVCQWLLASVSRRSKRPRLHHLSKPEKQRCGRAVKCRRHIKFWNQIIASRPQGSTEPTTLKQIVSSSCGRIQPTILLVLFAVRNSHPSKSRWCILTSLQVLFCDMYPVESHGSPTPTSKCTCRSLSCSAESESSLFKRLSNPGLAHVDPRSAHIKQFPSGTPKSFLSVTLVSLKESV